MDGRRECPAAVRRLWLASVLFLAPCSAWGYRPFVSTDAAVVDPRALEIELGYFTLERGDGDTTVITPQLVVNYGIVRDLEVVTEFKVDYAPDENARLADPGLFLKAVLKEGILQGQQGVSVAVEAGPLLPSTVPGERQFGFEGIGIVSGRLASFIYHLNIGGGVARNDGDPFTLWGLILELPLGSALQVVAEINGESVRGEPADNSGLLGFLWQPSSEMPIVFDTGIRRGFSREAPDWQYTLGLTVEFP